MMMTAYVNSISTGQEVDFMNIGIRMHDAAPGTLAQRAEFVKAQGFSCVHLALSKMLGPDYMEPRMATPGLAAQVRKDLSGLDIAVLGCYLNLAHPDRNAYQDTVKRYQAHLMLARWMGAGVVGTETGNPNAEYRYDPEKSHTEDALSLFIDRVAPVVEIAEKTGAVLAIEPVYTHIVSTPRRARKVLDAIHSPALRIILDPVNLLHADNFGQREQVLDEAMDVLQDEIVIIHMKDCVLDGGAVRSMACGLGGMDYEKLLRFALERKPGIQMTLEDTLPENAEGARLHLERAAAALTRA